MPLFELDETGSRLVRPMQPAAASFTPDSTALVTEHLSDLLGEGLFPVLTRRSPEDEQPHMLALDVVGQPVVVEVVAELDSESLIRALAYAGQAGRLTSGDLARLYHAGAEQFGVDLVAFRESLPAAYSRRGLRVGARLLLVCSSVHAEVADAIEFLRAPGRQVEVLQMGVIQGAGGRRYLDISPLAGPIAELRQVEQANLRLVRSEEAFAAAMAYDEQRKAFSRFAAAPEAPAEQQESPFAATGTDGSAPGTEVSTISAVSAASGPTPAVPPDRSHAPVPQAHASPASPTARFAPPQTTTPRVTPPTAESSASPTVAAPSPVQAAPRSAPPASPVAPPAPPAPPAAPLAPPAALADPPAPAGPPQAPTVPPGAPPPRTSVLPQSGAPVAPPAQQPAAQPAQSGPPTQPPARPSVGGEAYIPTFVPSDAPLISPDARELTEEPDSRRSGNAASAQATAQAPARPTPPASTSATAPAPAQAASSAPAQAALPARAQAAAPASAPAPQAPAQPGIPSSAQPGIPPSAPPPATRSPLPPPMALTSSSYSLGTHGAEPRPSGAAPTAAARQQPNPRLAAIVAELGPVELVWFRERRGQRLTAQLRGDGLIELPSGEVFGDPSAAAQIASHAALHVDGWGVWRIGDAGPTLQQLASS